MKYIKENEEALKGYMKMYNKKLIKEDGEFDIKEIEGVAKYIMSNPENSLKTPSQVADRLESMYGVLQSIQSYNKKDPYPNLDKALDTILMYIAEVAYESTGLYDRYNGERIYKK